VGTWPASTGENAKALLRPVQSHERGARRDRKMDGGHSPIENPVAAVADLGWDGHCTPQSSHSYSANFITSWRFCDDTVSPNWRKPNSSPLRPVSARHGSIHLANSGNNIVRIIPIELGIHQDTAEAVKNVDRAWTGSCTISNGLTPL
jgi:hypothetical protein